MSTEVEKMFVEHIKSSSSLGYGYTRSQVIQLASEFLSSIGVLKKPKLSQQWYNGFIRRWPELKKSQPSLLASVRAQASDPSKISAYFDELRDIFEKYDLANSSERLFNVDEKYVSTEHKPPHVLSSVSLKSPQAITSPRIGCTLIGAGNALGHYVPPYFCFKGTRLNPEWLHDTCPGTNACMSPTGWSNSDVFYKYMTTHLMKYMPSGQKVVLYDGHKSHVNPTLISWARQNDIHLMLFNPHLSHVLQPLDVGCFGPFQRIINSSSHAWLKNHPGQVIGKHNIVQIASKSYVSALSPQNLQASFKKNRHFSTKSYSLRPGQNNTT